MKSIPQYKEDIKLLSDTQLQEALRLNKLSIERLQQIPNHCKDFDTRKQLSYQHKYREVLIEEINRRQLWYGRGIKQKNCNKIKPVT